LAFISKSISEKKEEQMGINMASAFRLRNKLKERIKELTKACESISVTKARGKAENTTNFDGKSFADTVTNVSLLMATLRDFNLAIEKVNAVNIVGKISLVSKTGTDSTIRTPVEPMEFSASSKAAMD
jgi:hypothetical protein